MKIQIHPFNEFWATIEHSLNYKYKGNFPERELKRYAEPTYQLDEEMRKIRSDIQELQALFDPAYRG